jgi:pyrimidine-nucleoside phosphorylase
MLVLGRRADTLRAAKQMARQALDGEAAWAKFKALVAAQGGDVLFIEQPERLPQARFVLTVPSPSRGYVRQVDAREIGETVVTLGGGRSKKGEAIDHSVGVVVHFKVGDRVTKGEPLFTVHARSREDRDAAVERVLSACRFARERVEALPLFYRTIRS